MSSGRAPARQAGDMDRGRAPAVRRGGMGCGLAPGTAGQCWAAA
jgi:hypothetical protein